MGISGRLVKVEEDIKLPVIVGFPLYIKIVMDNFMMVKLAFPYTIVVG